MRTAIGLLVTFLALLGCEKKPDRPAAEPAAVPAAERPTEPPADKENKPELATVTVASTPGEATVSLDGAELGKTPYELKIRAETVIEVSHAGHLTKQVAVRPDGPPNVVVKLAAAAVPQPAVPQAQPALAPAAPPTAETAPASPTAITVASSPSEATVTLNGAKLGVTPLTVTINEPQTIVVSRDHYKPVEIVLNPNEPLVTASLEKLEPTAQPEKKGFATRRAAKAAYKTGRLSKERYKQIMRQMDAQEDAAIRRAKYLYDSGKISKEQYKQRRRAIDTRYD